MFNNYMLFEPDSDHGPSTSGDLSDEQKQNCEVRAPKNAGVARYLELLNAEASLYGRDCLLKELAASIRAQGLALSSDELALFVKQFHGEVNQNLSWAFARQLVAINNDEALVEASKSAPLEVTRLIAVIELKDLLGESFRDQSMARYKAHIEQALRNVILTDPSNHVRNYAVAAVLAFEYRYPTDFVQFCRQWYHVAARRVGATPKLQHPYVAGFLGALEASALAPIRSNSADQPAITSSKPAQSPPTTHSSTKPEKSSAGPSGPVHTHNTNEQTLKKIKIQQLLSTCLLIASVGVALFGNDFGVKAGIAGAVAALIWKFFIIPSQKWWHHG